MSPVTVTGVLGGRWRADVTAGGDVVPWDGSAPLTWHIAADDRWHTPSVEAAVRQTRLAGTPVTETRVRIPSGDAIQRVWSVADAGGVTLVSVTNESPLPIAIAFGRGDLRSVRPPTDMPIEGIELPAGAVAFPVGHHATVTVGLAHGGGRGVLPPEWPAAEQVVRGWVATAERAGRMVLPDETLADAIVAARCNLALAAAPEPADDPVGFLLAVDQLVRMGERADGWMPDVAHAAELLGAAGRGRRGRRALLGWDAAAALDSAIEIAIAAVDESARHDVVALRSRLSFERSLPSTPPDDSDPRWLAWQERRLIDPAPPGTCRLLPLGVPAEWLGASIEAHDLPGGDGARVSFALRWHGERPAVLWESSQPVELVAPVVAPDWSSTGAVRGEALWPPPVTAFPPSTSFS